MPFSLFSSETLDFFTTLDFSPKLTSSMDSSLLVLLLILIPLVPLSFLLVLHFIVRPQTVKIPIKNRHVFVTGGSSGIGLALARQAAAEGARVSILARSLTKLEEAREAIRLATGVDAAIFSADVRDAAAVARAVEEAGPIDVLVCNQGVFVPRELEFEDLDDVKFTMDVNVMGTFHLIKAALPGMKRRTKETGLPASIAIMSSQAGQVGLYGYTAYSASKFALRGLGESLQHEVIADNIRVSLIFPPDTETPGLVEESKLRPEVTTLIVGTGGVVMKADDVAKISLTGIKSGTFIVPCGFEGTMLSIATAGLSPQSSSFTAFIEVLGAGFMRFVGLIFQWNWYSIIEKHAKKSKKQFGRTDSQDPDPEGQIPQWEKASIQEMKDKFSAIGFGPRQLAVMSAFLGPDQLATETKLAADPEVRPWVEKYQRSRETVSQTDYEVDLITTLTKLSTLGQQINYEAYTYPVQKIELSKLKL